MKQKLFTRLIQRESAGRFSLSMTISANEITRGSLHLEAALGA